MIDLMRLPAGDRERIIHLQAIIDNQQADWEFVRQRRDYFDGRQRVFLTTNQQKWLGLFVNPAPTVNGQSFSYTPTFAVNQVRNLVNTVIQRLRVVGFTVGGHTAGQSQGEDDTISPEAEAAALLWQWWAANDLDTLQIDLYRRAERDDVSYVMVSWDTENDRPAITVQARYDGAIGLTTHLDAEMQRPMYHCKYWFEYDPLTPGVTGRERKTVYLPGQILKYRQAGNSPETAYNWQPVQDPGETAWPVPWTGVDGQPLGFAVWPFRVPGGSVLSVSFLDLQDALNAAALDLLAAAAAHGFPVMAIEYDASIAPPPSVGVDAKDEEGAALEIAPGRYVELYGAKLSRLPAGDLTQMIATIQAIINLMAGVTGLHVSHFWPAAGSDAVSGESLRMRDGALVAMAEERQLAFTSPWGNVMQVAWKLAQRYSRRPLPRVDGLPMIRPVWADANVRSELTQAQVAQIHRGLGVPDEMIWQRQLGYTPDEVAQFQENQRRNDALKIATIAAQLRLSQSAPGAQPAPGKIRNQD